MLHEFGHRPTQVALIEGDHKVETLPPKCSHDALTKGVRFWRSNRRPERFHAEAFQSSIHCRGEDAVAIVNHKTIRMIELEECAELLNRPFRSWMSGHVGVQNPTGAD